MKSLKGINFKLTILLPIAIAYLLFIVHIDAAPYQELEPRKGWVPVYIRYGDTPLSEIHPKLAEAFHENEGEISPKIESANLTLEDDSKKDSPTEKSVTNQNETLKSETKDSDIASFDVVKGIDKDDSEQKSV